MNGLAQVRALQVLAAASIESPTRLEPASSVTNEVWLTPQHVIRINRKATGRLRREAMLSRVLPPATGYPGIVSSGDGSGIDWLIMKRRPGVPLGRAWPTMSEIGRRRAISQLAAGLKAIHGTPTPPGLPSLPTPQLIDADAHNPFAPAQYAVHRAREIASIPNSVVDGLALRMQQLAGSVGPFGGETLVHGDLTFENMLWDGRDLTAIIDFEWSRGAPRDLDLDVFLRMCAYPFLHVAADLEAVTHRHDYVDVPTWLAQDYPELFRAPRLIERLELYSLAFDLRDLIECPPEADLRRLSKYHALHRIIATLEGRGHLAQLFSTSVG